MTGSVLPSPRMIRYAVVGLGSIAQTAVLPAFANAGRNSRLTALISADAEKRDRLGHRYSVENLFSSDDYEAALRSGEFDAVYIAIPNSLHRDYSVRAAQAGIHVLCEKPMAVTESECRDMIRAARESDVRLMVAYRLHFEEANLSAVEAVESGRLGDPRIFESVFTFQVRDAGNVRLKRSLGGGTLYDIGIYCINAARYLFRDEPEEVAAFTSRGEDPRFSEVEEMAAACLRFPGDRLATFSCSFGAETSNSYELIGTHGRLRLDPAYTYSNEMVLTTRIGKRTRTRRFARRDQFAPEILAFSDAILAGRDPEPDGEEGLADVRIIRALYESARTRRPVILSEFEKSERPEPDQEIHRPGIREPEVIHAKSPGGDD